MANAVATLIRITAILLVFWPGESSTQCPVIEGSQRRECYPWPEASEEACEARGCVWCDDSFPYPSCFYDDTVCPSEIPEADRTDCLPDGGFKPDCLNNGCLWCETDTPGIPYCFPDPNASQGGSTCPESIPEAERIDCHPEPDATEDDCLKRGCYWCPSTNPREPWCFVPTQNGYRLVGAVTDTDKGFTATLQRINTPSWYGSDIQVIQMDVEFQTEDRLRIKFSDPNNARYEVPLTIDSPPTKYLDPQYDVIFDESSPSFGFQVIRQSTGEVIFDSTMGGFVFSDQFLQIAARLSSDNVYGFGEHEHQSLKHNLNWITWAMYARDQAVTDSNLYGVHPFYMNLGQTDDAHGVLFLNSNAQEVTLSPAPALTYRTIGGVLDLYFFLGPTPDNVVQQYTEAIGRPVMVPYWALGFQLCKWGYQTLDDLKAAVGRMRQYDIPHDVQYGDVDYMDGHKIFTYDPVAYAGLPEYVQQLKQEGTRFVIILDPGIYNLDEPGVYPPLDEGTAQDVWVKRSDGSYLDGEVWPGQVYYPDFTKPATQDWWTDQAVDFIQVVEYAGLWIDMNEPSNFVDGDGGSCANTSINYPPYMPAILDRSLFIKTICPDSIQDAGIAYDVHSLYGWSMSMQTLPATRAATGLRSVAFSRSTFPGSGAYAQHWLGDNFSQWPKLAYSLIGTMEFNMFGYPYVGPDICGFNGDTTEQLCLRWHQVGAFYPFSRNHNAYGQINQDPGSWPDVAQVARDSLLIRYTLLPYLYTLMHKAHALGSTVVRPLFFEFPSDATTHDIYTQFLWGSAFLVSPVLTEDVTTVDAYFPDARWFSYYDGSVAPARGGYATLDAPFDFINLHIRGGYILPTQVPANSTMFSRGNPMGLIVALDDTAQAAGDLFWDDGESIVTFETGIHYFANFAAFASGQLTSTIFNNGYPGVDELYMDNIVVMGIDFTITSLQVNFLPHDLWVQDVDTLQLTITGINLPLTEVFVVQWS